MLKQVLGKENTLCKKVKINRPDYGKPQSGHYTFKYFYPMIKNREYYLKKLVREAFDKAKEDSVKKSLNGWSTHIENQLDGKISTQTIKRMHFRYVEGKSSVPEAHSNSIDELCKYLGFEDYTAFVNAVDVEISLENISYAEIRTASREKIASFTKKLAEHPHRRDQNASRLFWLGVLLLQQKQFDAASGFLSMALSIDPTNDECYYNLALARCCGKRPFRLSMKAIRTILDHLNMAIRLNGKKAKFYHLRVFINKDYYQRRGLRGPENNMADFDANLLETDEMELERAAIDRKSVV